MAYNCLQVNLMSYMKLSTYRDFRIYSNRLQAVDEQDQSVSIRVCKKRESICAHACTFLCNAR
jgi:hypothetical protein